MPLADRVQPTSDLAAHFRAVRAQTEALAARLSPEDQNLQSMTGASPAKWHRAHTTWFFETFVLEPHEPGYRPSNPAYRTLFNSYYEAVGARHERSRRGLLSRPGVEEVAQWRRSVDERVISLLSRNDAELAALVVIGLNHEQQHQELLLTDVKHAFAQSPLRPAYARTKPARVGLLPPMRWLDVPEGVHEIGHGNVGFSFDNEGPRHRVFLRQARVAHRPVTNAEWEEFIEDRGYERPELWLSDGWATVQREGWRAPLYWERHDGAWWTFTLSGMRPVQLAEPTCHVSLYEADAFARWAGLRLPTEAEWEVAGRTSSATTGTLLESDAFHPGPVGDEPRFLGDVWQWTSSAYSPYPGFKPWPGALAEYNGKFMSGQGVVRGASCVTPTSHARITYRNFFPPEARWQFTGVRLARDA